MLARSLAVWLARCLARLWLALVLIVSAGDAAAAPPTISTGWPVVGNPSFSSIANTMMYTVEVKVDTTGSGADYNAVVGITTTAGSSSTTCPTGATYRWSHSQVFDTSATRTWTLYNFQPGGTYYHKVRIGGGIPFTTACGPLTTTAAPTPTLPTNLGSLTLAYGGSGGHSSTYVLLDTDDCGGGSKRRYLIAIDTASTSRKIVWYLDVDAMGSGTTTDGWRYQEGSSTPTTNRILATVDHRYLYKWGWDGTTTLVKDYGSSACGSGTNGPCPSHDAFETDAGTTYVVNSQMSATGPVSPWPTGSGPPGVACAPTKFVDDGYDRITSSGSAGKYLMTDFGYDPTVLPGIGAPTACPGGYWSGVFPPSIDWTHGNSVSAVTISGTEYLYLSLKAWDQIVRVNTSTGAKLWVSADTSYTDLTLEKDSAVGFPASMLTDFGDQHDVHSVGTNMILMFDNTGGGLGSADPDNGGSRVLQVALNASTGKATIKKNWRVVDDSTMTPAPYDCPAQGSAEWVPTNTNNVLALCNEKRVIEELATSTGSKTRPLLYMELSSCSNGIATSTISGWYRAFPVSAIGEF